MMLWFALLFYTFQSTNPQLVLPLLLQVAGLLPDATGNSIPSARTPPDAS
jgi:hypothetical protein